MQNQVALYLIFISGAVLIIASLLDWDYLFGVKKDKRDSEDAINNSVHPHLMMRVSTTLFSWMQKPLNYVFKEGNDPERRSKRVFYAILGLIFILLGIIALNSGKFS
jgi:uncharacterized membrane protein